MVVENITISNEGNTSVCEKDALINGFGWFIQGVLAGLAFACLILKRFICEPKKERRTWLIWFYDTSKQGLGAMVIHFANVFLAGFFVGDPCTWYLTSFLLDSSLGLLIIYAGIRTSQYIAKKKGYNTLIFGEYGSPPKVEAWMHQCLLYICLMLVEKSVMTLLVQLDMWKSVRDLILYPIKDPTLRLEVVVLIVPFFVNALMFWVVDNFLMRQHGVPSTRSRTRARYKLGQEGHDSESDVLISGEEDGTLHTNDKGDRGTRHHLTTSALP